MKATLELDEHEILEAVKAHLRAQGYAVASGTIRIDEWEEDRGGGKTQACVAVLKLDVQPKATSTQGDR